MNRAFAIVLLVTTLAATTWAAGTASASPAAPAPAAVGSTVDDDTTRPTVNDFLPEERPLGDCLGALQRPNCGSDARGGWRQTTVFALILAGVAFIAWRVVATSRRALRDQADRDQAGDEVTPRTPDATSAPDASGGDPTP